MILPDLRSKPKEHIGFVDKNATLDKKACLPMTSYRNMTDEEFSALPKEERNKAVLTASMCAEYLGRTEWFDGQFKSAKEWEKTLQNLLGKPKKQQRQIASATVQTIVLTAALVLVLVVI